MMHSTRRRLRHLAGLGGLLLALGAGLPAVQAVQAEEQVQTQAQLTLGDAWLAWQQAYPGVVPWQHAVALRHDTASTLDRERRFLANTLATLGVSARVAGDARRAAGLQAWQATLAAWDPAASRTPGRFDLPWLGAHRRDNPPLASLVHYGVCEPPAWVEVWSLDGVRRLAWSAAQNLDELLAALSPQAARDADWAAVVAPDGRISRRGVAAWNHQPTPLVPGSRVLLELPGERGLRAASPFPGTRGERELVNDRLPALLATRLPGDACPLTRTP
ncbi:capsule biosynthesis GfcC family protein [Halomonas sp. HK25]|uniref:capsule biosynthesis GfcC family protein n=1 Tax=Halomonas sp. HK25 TaxID=3394321 RepID=UPI0039FC1404